MKANAEKKLEKVRRFKVIRIYRTWAENKHEALKWVIESEPAPEVEFAVEEQPKGWFGATLKQMFG